MKRLVVLVGLVGCTGDIGDSLPPGLTPEQAKAQKAWTEKALPVFTEHCAMCHDGSMADAPGYLAGTSDLMKRDTIVAFVPQVVNFNAPQSSRVLTKGLHTGPALSAQDATGVLAWITAERDARPPNMIIETGQMMPMMCTTPPCPVNTIDLGTIVPGSKFEFEATQVGADLYITKMLFTAGPMGLYVEHPLWLSYPPAPEMPKPDGIDRFYSVRLNLMPAATAPLGAGEATFAGFSGANPINIRFDALEMKRP